MSEEQVTQIKKLQRTDAGGKEAWIKYVEQHGNNVRDPSKHEGSFIEQFLAQYTPGENPSPATDSFAEHFKEAQRNSLNFKRCWAQFREAFADGKNDPARVPKDQLYSFLEFLGQQGLVAIGPSGGKSGKGGGQDMSNGMTPGEMMAMQKGQMMGMSKGMMKGGGDMMGMMNMMGMQGKGGKGNSKGKDSWGCGGGAYVQGGGNWNNQSNWDDQSGYDSQGDGGYSNYGPSSMKQGWSQGFDSSPYGGMQSYGGGGHVVNPWASLQSGMKGGSKGGKSGGKGGAGKGGAGKGGAGGVGITKKAALGDKIKAYQRGGEMQKQIWEDFCDQGHAGVREPSKLPESALQEFCNNFAL